MFCFRKAELTCDHRFYFIILPKQTTMAGTNAGDATKKHPDWTSTVRKQLVMPLPGADVINK